MGIRGSKIGWGLATLAVGLLAVCVVVLPRLVSAAVPEPGSSDSVPSRDPAGARIASELSEIVAALHQEYVVAGGARVRHGGEVLIAEGATPREAAGQLAKRYPLSSQAQSDVASYGEALRVAAKAPVADAPFTPAEVTSVTVSPSPSAPACRVSRRAAGTERDAARAEGAVCELLVVTRYSGEGPPTEELMEFRVAIDPVSGRYLGFERIDPMANAVG